MKKWIFRISVALVVLVTIGMVAFALTLDGAIKKGVERFGPQVAKVDVKLASVNLSPLSGSGSIKGLVIGNPEGYKAAHAISVGSSSVALSLGSLLSDKVVIKSIRVEAPEIVLELGPGGSNLQKIQANLPSGRSAAGTGDRPVEEKKPGKKLQVDEVVVTGGKLILEASALGGRLSEAPLPEVRLANLGSGPDGITASELGTRILSAVMDGAISISGEALAKAGRDAIDNATKGASNALNQATSDATGKAAKSIGDLLNKKRE